MIDRLLISRCCLACSWLHFQLRPRSAKYPFCSARCGGGQTGHVRAGRARPGSAGASDPLKTRSESGASSKQGHTSGGKYPICIVLIHWRLHSHGGLTQQPARKRSSRPVMLFSHAGASICVCHSAQVSNNHHTSETQVSKDKCHRFAVNWSKHMMNTHNPRRNLPWMFLSGVAKFGSAPSDVDTSLWSFCVSDEVVMALNGVGGRGPDGSHWGFVLRRAAMQRLRLNGLHGRRDSTDVLHAQSELKEGTLTGITPTNCPLPRKSGISLLKPEIKPTSWLFLVLKLINNWHQKRNTLWNLSWKSRTIVAQTK